MVTVEKLADGSTAVDSEQIVRATLKLLAQLAELAKAVKLGLEQCPRGSMPCIGLNHETLEAFSEIFKSAARVQAALSEASDAAACVESGDYGLAAMETQGRG